MPTHFKIEIAIVGTCILSITGGRATSQLRTYRCWQREIPHNGWSHSFPGSHALAAGLRKDDEASGLKPVVWRGCFRTPSYAEVPGQRAGRGWGPCATCSLLRLYQIPAGWWKRNWAHWSKPPPHRRDHRAVEVCLFKRKQGGGQRQKNRLPEGERRGCFCPRSRSAAFKCPLALPPNPGTHPFHR